MKRLAQLWVCLPPTCTAAAAATLSLSRAALGHPGTSATHLQVRCATTQRRVVRPTEKGVADLMDDVDDEADDAPRRSRDGRGGGGTTAAAAAITPALSSVVESASRYRQAAQHDDSAENEDRQQRRSPQQQQQQERADAMKTAGQKDEDMDNEGNAGDEDEEGSTLQPEESHKSNSNKRSRMTDRTREEDVDGAAVASEASRLLRQAQDEERAFIAEQQEAYYEMPIQHFTDVLCAYLRATENVALVSATEEHALFPVLQNRLNEFHVMQLLDVMECHWSRSTMLRYGTRFKDAVRDRIAQLATAAAAQLEARKRQDTTTSLRERGSGDDVLPDDDEGEDARDDAIFVKDQQSDAAAPTAAASSSADVMLANAAAEITAATIYRALVVTAMSAGRRKRDQVFFQLLGSYLAYFINDYKDPNDLVRVLTALARAKVLPSAAFLSLLARRLPVLHKRVPLQPVPAYRAMSNFSRMGHTSINTFRFLADCTVLHMEQNIREEKKQLKAQQKQQRAMAAEKEGDNTGAEKKSGAVQEAASPETSTSSLRHLRADAAAKQRLHRLSGLKPSTFTRLLYILARVNAPHQQYLRPLITPVILPMLPYFPPPSFTRLLKATQLFHSTDAALIEAYGAHVCDVLAPAGRLTRPDVLVLLQLLSLEDTPVPVQLDRLLVVCCDTLRSATTGASSPREEKEGERSPSPPARGTVTLLLRPVHMCRVLHSLGGLQRRVEVPLESLTPLVDLADDFARHLALLMELRVVSLQEVDEYISVCERHQIPDRTGALEQLALKRRSIATHPRSEKHDEGVGAAAVDEEEDYYSQLDVDVRETFAKILTASDFNTYGGYRPLPGPLQVDFREELTRVSAFELLQAVDLFDKACPSSLQAALRLFLSRSFLEKVGQEGEVVVEEETNELVIRQPRAQLLTREDLTTFVELVLRTPLEAVRKAPATWQFIQDKAERLGVSAVAETATERLRKLRA